MNGISFTLQKEQSKTRLTESSSIAIFLWIVCYSLLRVSLLKGSKWNRQVLDEFNLFGLLLLLCFFSFPIFNIYIILFRTSFRIILYFGIQVFFFFPLLTRKKVGISICSVRPHTGKHIFGGIIFKYHWEFAPDDFFV